jgi:hypothetical protein
MEFNLKNNSVSLIKLHEVFITIFNKPPLSLHYYFLIKLHEVFITIFNPFLMTFLTTLDIYGVKNSLFRYLWMLKSPIFSVMQFPRFRKINKINSFWPTFSNFWQNKHLFTLLKTLISLTPNKKLVSNQFCIITKG